MLRLYNTLSRTVEPFAPQRDGEVRMYVCGLTPSAQAHLGHARSFLFFDVLRRYLRHPRNGYRVRYVQNVTDVDDRSIAAAKAENRSYDEIVGGHYASFKRSMRRLNVEEPDVEPHATQYIAQMLTMIDALVERGAAYASADGVYFSVASFPRYGELAHRNLDELLVGARIAPGEQKRDPLDFALWKLAKPGEPSWPSRYGDGRPGWHIECSAMAHELLGEPFDIHGGGFDLVFPHHENEIAQTETFLGRGPMAEVWLHGGLLLFDGRKMSKSLGNFEPLAALLERIDPFAIRLLFLQTGYRKPMNWTEDSIAGATTALEKMEKAAYVLASADRVRPDERFRGDADADFTMQNAFSRTFAALDDDMNTAGAVAMLADVLGNPARWIREGSAAQALAFVRDAGEILGLGPVFAGERLARHSEVAVSARARERRAGLDPLIVDRLRRAVGDVVHLNGGVPEEVIEAVVARRSEAKASRDFALADRLRNALAAENISLKDAKNAPTTWTIEG